MKKSIVKLGIIVFSLTAITPSVSASREISKQSVSSKSLLLAQNSSGRTQSTLKTGAYYAGSRFIIIARKGDRFCYEGISIPHGRYAVAVGETIGSLSRTRSGFVIDGLKRRGKRVILSQSGNQLLITDGKNPQMEYKESEASGSSPDEISSELKKCLNSKGVFFIPVPGSGYRIK